MNQMSRNLLQCAYPVAPYNFIIRNTTHRLFFTLRVTKPYFRILCLCFNAFRLHSIDPTSFILRTTLCREASDCSSRYLLSIQIRWVSWLVQVTSSLYLQCYPRHYPFGPYPQCHLLLPEIIRQPVTRMTQTCLDEPFVWRKFIGNLALGTSRCLFWRR